MVKYTANDFRNAASYVETYDVFEEHDREIANMLLHAAEMMEREEREKKYEYSVYPPEVNGVFQYRAGAELKAFMLKQNGYRDETVIRREVGEWEKVTNG